VCKAAAGACHAFTTVALLLVKVTGAAVTSPSPSATTTRLWALRAGTAEIQEKTLCALGLLGTANPYGRTVFTTNGVHYPTRESALHGTLG